ncbi:rifin [Plasmodium sp. gorilla clade G1]|nr:rifin [Plasmodium sp. gorilla clade G1]
MKVHYINILMFALPLNILVSYPKNPCKTLHTRINKSTKPHRLLCECQLYAPQNYDNDPDMKKVMENFGRKTSQRFEEYNERMIKNKQKCKDQCYKDVQKIILKDKIEKELTEKLSTLQTDISTDEIPTCVCEKSLADKVEKTCLRCTQNLGGIVAPSSGVLGGIAELGLSEWKPIAIDAAIAAAKKSAALAGEAARIKEGMHAVISELYRELGVKNIAGQTLKSFINRQNYNNAASIYQAVYKQYEATCMTSGPVPGVFSGDSESICSSVLSKALDGGFNPQGTVSMKTVIESNVETIVLQAESVAEFKAIDVTTTKTAVFKVKNMATVEGICNSYNTAIIASIVAIVVIVLIMVIIYLILHYRRKKKMKK